MKNLDTNLLKKFKSKILSDDFKNARIIYRVKGGTPTERIEKEVLVNADGKVETIINEDQLGVLSKGKKSITRKDDEIKNLFKEVTNFIDQLAADDSKFLPDSIIGSISIQIEDKETTIGYFLPEEEDRKVQNKFVGPNFSNVINKLESFFQEDG
jgi:hypothetical protein